MHIIKRPRLKLHIKYTSNLKINLCILAICDNMTNLIKIFLDTHSKLSALNEFSKTEINILNLKNEFSITKKELSNLKNEFEDTKNEISNLKNSLLEMKNNYGYDTFIKIREEQTILERERAYNKIYSSVPKDDDKKHNDVTTKALTVVKTRKAFSDFTNNKKGCEIFFKIIAYINNSIIIKLFYIKNMIY